MRRRKKTTQNVSQKVNADIEQQTIDEKAVVCDAVNANNRSGNADIHIVGPNEVVENTASEEKIMEHTATENVNEEAASEMRMDEDICVQRAEWVMQQLKTKNQKETEAWMKTMEAQRLVNEKSDYIYADIDQARRMQKYQKDMQQDIATQVYQMHGVSQDKLQGMREYKNARKQGMALAEFVITAVLLAACVFFYGFTNDVTLLMLSGLATEAALLPQVERRGKGMDLTCHILYLLVLPAMAAALLVHEMGTPTWYEYTAMGIVIGEAAMLVVATISYFVYNPYRRDRKNVRAAARDLKKLEKIARQNVAAKEKARIKRENKEEKLRIKAEKKAQKLKEKEDKKNAKKQEALRKKEARAQEKLDKKKQKEETITSATITPETEAVDQVQEQDVDQMQKQDAQKDTQIISIVS